MPGKELKVTGQHLPRSVVVAALCALPWLTAAHAADRRIVDDRTGAAGPGWAIERFGDVRSATLRALPEAAGRAEEAEIVSRDEAAPRAQLVRPLRLEAGHLYRVSLEIAGSEGTRVEVMLRRGPPPYDPVALRTVTLGDAWRTVTFEAAWPVTADPGGLRVVWQGPQGRVRVRNVQVDDAGALPLGTPGAPFSPWLVGLHVNQLGRHSTWPDAGQKMLRLTSTGTDWFALAPTRETFDRFEGPGWKRLDLYVDYARRNDPTAVLLYTLGMPPPWASGSPDATHCALGRGTCGAPASLDEWRHYVRTVAERYRGRIRHWELWNEPDNRVFYTSTRPLAELARAASEELKAVDPQNVLLSPGFTQSTGLLALHRFLEQGGGRWVDAVGFHWYYDAQPEKLAALIHNVRQAMRAHGVGDKPIWNTEGAPLCQPPIQGACVMGGLTPEQQEGVAARAIVTMWLNGVQAYAYYTAEGMGGRTLPLIAPDLKGTTPAAQRLKAFARWMNGQQAAAVTRWGRRGHAVELRRGSSRSYLVWTEADTERFAIPREWRVTRAEPLGEAAARLDAGSLEVGPLPVLLGGQD